jgi:hypothetical protein
MNITSQLRDPFSAAIVAAILTAGYIHFKAKLNNQTITEAHEYTKPAFLNAIMVYMIVSYGMSQQEVISSEPF